MTRNQATLAGATRSNNRKAMTAPMYWALAEQIKKNSGGNPPTRVLSDFCVREGELLVNRTVQDQMHKFLGKAVEIGTNLLQQTR